MLVEFKFSNFRSFKEEASFSMEPSSQNGSDPNVITTNLKKVPQLYRTAGIFGANASGKSNVLSAFLFFKFLIQTSSDNKFGDEFPKQFYALAKEYDNNIPMSFSIKFITNTKLYEYKFSISYKVVLQESLYYFDISSGGTNKPNRIFERVYSEGKSIFKKSKGIMQSWCNEVNDNRLFLSDIINNRNCQIDSILESYKWITQKLHALDTAKLNEGFSLKQIADGKGEDIIDLIKKADLGLDKMSVRNVPLEELIDNAKNNGKELSNKVIDAISKKKAFVFDAKSYHKTEEGELKEFDFDETESDGTKRFLSLSGPLLETIDKGGTLLVDELDISLHPYLVQYLVSLFNNQNINTKGAQLVFTSYAHYLMDGKLLSRDQIWFVSKELNNGFYSDLYSLSDFKKITRKNISFYNAYMDGIYGGVPYLEKL